MYHPYIDFIRLKAGFDAAGVVIYGIPRWPSFSVLLIGTREDA